MNTLFCSLSICVGIFLSAYSLRVVVLRGIGYTRLFVMLDFLMNISPYLSILILLLVGFLTIPEKSKDEFQNILVKVCLSVVVAVIPLAIMMLMYKWTYSPYPVVPKYFRLLSANEWFILLLGFLLNGVGIFLLRPKRRARI